MKGAEVEVDEGIRSFLSCILVSVCTAGLDGVYQGRLCTCTIVTPQNCNTVHVTIALLILLPSPRPSLSFMCAADNLPLDSLLPAQCLKQAVSLGGDGYKAYPSSAAAETAV